MLPEDGTLDGQRAARERFLALVAEVRTDLHRYCARMTGSVTDGEDVVQDTLARAYFLLPELSALPEVRPWLFRVAHHRAIDFLRRYDRRMGESIDADAPAIDGPAAADDAIARAEAVAAALSRFVELPPGPRSCVILKDVLGHSLEEIAALLELGLPAVKAALHRGRERLREAGPEAESSSPPASQAVARYVALFNARDWDGFRALLADDVRLDVVSRAQRRGRREVGEYVDNYSRRDDWDLCAATLDGREVVAVIRHPDAAAPAYFVEPTFVDGRVASIRDFRYVPFIATDARLLLT
jgi:RNA polymerase sigma factor (sigma-70 family)